MQNKIIPTFRYVIAELIETEKDYVRDLGLVINVCISILCFG